MFPCRKGVHLKFRVLKCMELTSKNNDKMHFNLCLKLIFDQTVLSFK
jgi:hypothetical protein